MEREEISFISEGLRLAGWLYLPAAPAIQNRPAPVIVMAHGFAAVKEQYLDSYAQVFAEAGLAALVFDYRNFGESEGQPRQEVDPWAQLRDYRNAISYAQTRPELDPRRIGVWGTSFSGGHALVLGATDRRVKCVVSQVPTISGYQSWLRRVRPDQQAPMQALFEVDRAEVYAGGQPQTRPVVPEAEGQAGQYGSEDALAFFARPQSRPPRWQNAVTLRSLEMARDYEPGSYVARISPTPLLMIVSDHDTVTLTDLALGAYEKALEPKKLVLLPGEHFTPYSDTFEAASVTARDWFAAHLLAY